MSGNEKYSEADLCRDFIEWCGPEWIVYPETGGFDILLSRKSDGVQVGIEAKRSHNGKVIEQAAKHDFSDVGPDYRSILVPSRNASLMGVTHMLDVNVVDRREGGFSDLPARLEYRWRPAWHIKRVSLPEYVPDTRAGTPAPIKLTGWKISAMKLCVVLMKRGHITRDDCRWLRISPSSWCSSSGFLTKGKVRGQWVLPEGRAPDLGFAEQHPKNWQEIVDDFDNWGASWLVEAPE